MSNIGRPQTRAVMAAELSKWYNIPLNANVYFSFLLISLFRFFRFFQHQHLVLSCGAAAAINVLFHSIIPADSEIIIIAPFFAEYLRYIENVKSKAVIVSASLLFLYWYFYHYLAWPEADFDLDIPAIQKAITPKTRAIIINSPNNPTGKIYSEATLIELGKMLMGEYQKRLAADPASSPIFIISDEPYRRISYMGPARNPEEGKGDSLPSVMNCYAYTFIVSSFSKDLSLPGERIGWVAMHPCLYSPELQASLTVCSLFLS